MFRRHPIRKASIHQQNQDSHTSLRVLPSSSHSIRKRSRKYKPADAIFKVIVAVELLFLACMWSFYSDRLLSSSLWQRQTTHYTNIPRNAAKGSIVNNHGMDDDDGASEDDDEEEEEEQLSAWERRLIQESRERRMQHEVQDEEDTPGWERALRDEAREHRRPNFREQHDKEQAARRELAKMGLLHSIPEEWKGPALVIGGSDGSGTRAFARYMPRLGIPMTIDDKDTLDVHGAVMFGGQGWPPLAKSILNETHSANYELSDLPTETEEKVKKELKKLKDSFDKWQLKFEQQFMVRQKMNMHVARATNAAMGFKAPVTMLLLPLLKEVFGKVKYLHIVRDGRDVALSTNKSPVQKFYESMYTNAEEQMKKYTNDSYPVLAMNLWNDWNTQALEWERAHTGDADFDSLVMRSEDLVDPSKKFEVLARLAKFVGSPKTLEEICCMSREQEIDMGQSLVSSEVAAGDYKQEPSRGFWGGQHRLRKRQFEGLPGRLRRPVTSDGGTVTASDGGATMNGFENRPSFHHLHGFFHGRFEMESEDDEIDGENDDNHRRLSEQTASQEPSSQVHSRYGKWREFLRDKPDLSAMLHKEGSQGLAAFGYEPASDFMDPDTSPVKDFVCDETVVCQ